LVQAEDAGERVEDLLGRLGRAALFEAHVVVDADPGQMRDLFAPQPDDAAAAIGGDTDVRRVDPGTPGPQEAGQIIHGPSMAAAGTAKVVLPIPGSPVRRTRCP